MYISSFLALSASLAASVSSRSVQFIERDFKERCGPDFGSCSEGYCCSVAGYCGKSVAHCKSPDCQLDYGFCDAHRVPEGPSTSNVSRPHVGRVPYGPTIISSCTVPGTIALTFDDGPSNYTEDLLDLLEKYDAKATFFVAGVNNGKGQIDDFRLPWGHQIQRMYEHGHQIASHTWSHQDLSRITPSQLRAQILKNEAALRNILGMFPTYMRPPYSSCTEESGCLDEMGELGYHIILFDLDTDDYNNDSPAAIQKSKNLFDKTLDDSAHSDKPWLVISHDVHDQTVHNLTEYMLNRIHDGGYRTVTVGECLGDPKENWYRQTGESDELAVTPTNSSTAQPDGSKPTQGSSTSTSAARSFMRDARLMGSIVQVLATLLIGHALL